VPSSLSPSEALVKKAKKPRYESIATHLEGRFLRAIKGERPTLTRSNLGKIAATGRKLATIDTKIAELQAERLPLEQEAIDFVKEHEGVSGLESVTHNFRLSIFARYDVDNYDIEKLRGILGAAYSTVIGEGLTTTVSVPFGLETSAGLLDAEKIQGAFTSGLVGIGLTEKQISQFVNTQPFLEVKEKQLGQLIINDQVDLPSDVATVTEEWSATTAPLK
jgi:hypothetical protein